MKKLENNENNAKRRESKRREAILEKFAQKTEGNPPCFSYRFLFPKSDHFCRVCRKGKSPSEIEAQIQSYACFLKNNPDLWQNNNILKDKKPEEIATMILSCPYSSQLREQNRRRVIAEIVRDIKCRFPDDSPESLEIRREMMIAERGLEFRLEDELVRRKRKDFIESLVSEDK